MNLENDPHLSTPGPLYQLLEIVASVVLISVLAALAWMIVAAYRPELGRIADPTLEVAAVVVLLLAALGLVSLVALVHTRK